MGKILEYNDFNAAPADADLLFFADASNTAANPATFRLKISDLNKKRNVDAATSAGLLLRDDSSTFGIKIHDGGNVGVGPGAATTPAAFLSVRGAADSNLTLANFLNPSATTNGRYQQIIFGTDTASDKSVVFRYYYSTVDDASTLRIQSYEDAVAENENPTEGWKVAFEEIFDLSIDTFYRDFDAFMLQDRDSQMSILPSNEELQQIVLNR